MRWCGFLWHPVCGFTCGPVLAHYRPYMYFVFSPVVQKKVLSLTIGSICRPCHPLCLAPLPQTLHNWVSEELAGRSSSAALLSAEGNQEERCKQVPPVPTRFYWHAPLLPARRLTDNLQAVKALPHQHLCFSRSAVATLKMTVDVSLFHPEKLMNRKCLLALKLLYDKHVDVLTHTNTLLHVASALVFVHIVFINCLSNISYHGDISTFRIGLTFTCFITVLFTHLQKLGRNPTGAVG